MQFDIGTTVQTSHYRAHRAAEFIEIVELRTKGRAAKLVVKAGFSRIPLLADVAAFVAFALDADVSIDALCAALADVVDIGLQFVRSAIAATGIMREPAIVVKSPAVSASFGTRAGGAWFTVRGHAVLVRALEPKDAAKMHAWAKEHSSELPTMSPGNFRTVMHHLGARTVVA